MSAQTVHFVLQVPPHVAEFMEEVAKELPGCWEDWATSAMKQAGHNCFDPLGEIHCLLLGGYRFKTQRARRQAEEKIAALWAKLQVRGGVPA